jgi:uncharacterized protein (DUF3084 family)
MFFVSRCRPYDPSIHTAHACTRTAGSLRGFNLSDRSERRRARLGTRAVESESNSEGILGGVGVEFGRNFRWTRSRKEFLGGVGVGRNF